MVFKNTHFPNTFFFILTKKKRKARAILPLPPFTFKFPQYFRA